jgi:Metallopeptidase family M24
MTTICLPSVLRRPESLKRGIIRNSQRRWAVTASSIPIVKPLPGVKDLTKNPTRAKKWVKPYIPSHIRRPHYAETGEMSPWNDVIPLAHPIGPTEWYDEHLAEGMRHAGRVAAAALEYAVSLVKPGITTREIDQKVTEWAFSQNCYPSSLNYGGFPGSLCTSVDNVLSHGVPSEYRILIAPLTAVDFW